MYVRSTIDHHCTFSLGYSPQVSCTFLFLDAQLLSLGLWMTSGRWFGTRNWTWLWCWPRLWKEPRCVVTCTMQDMYVHACTQWQLPWSTAQEWELLHRISWRHLQQRQVSDKDHLPQVPRGLRSASARGGTSEETWSETIQMTAYDMDTAAC